MRRAAFVGDAARLLAGMGIVTMRQPGDAEARIDAHFDGVDADIARIHAQMKADGLVREPKARTRAGDRA